MPSCGLRNRDGTCHLYNRDYCAADPDRSGCRR
jgi:hypothetical protein